MIFLFFLRLLKEDHKCKYTSKGPIWSDQCSNQYNFCKGTPFNNCMPLHKLQYFLFCMHNSHSNVSCTGYDLVVVVVVVVNCMFWYILLQIAPMLHGPDLQLALHGGAFLLALAGTDSSPAHCTNTPLESIFIAPGNKFGGGGGGGGGEAGVD